MPYQLLAR